MGDIYEAAREAIDLADKYKDIIADKNKMLCDANRIIAKYENHILDVRTAIIEGKQCIITQRKELDKLKGIVDAYECNIPNIN